MDTHEYKLRNIGEREREREREREERERERDRERENLISQLPLQS